MAPSKPLYLKFLFALIAFVSLIILGQYIVSKTSKSIVKESFLVGEVFGVETYKITIISDVPEAKLLAFQKDILTPFLKKINQEFSTYIPESYISKLNQLELNVLLPTSPLFDEAFEESIWVHQETEGAFDPSVGSLINLWGFGEKPHDKNAITEEAVKEAKSQTGMDAFTWVKGSIKKNRKVSLNLSSVAEGLAVDLVAKLLDKEGYQNYLIDIGGENLSRGLNFEGKPFRIGLEIPRDSNDTEKGNIKHKVELKNAAIATSGNYKQFYIKDGKRLSHIIDPTTGYPAQNNLASVTVITKSCMRADTISTAFMVMGFEKSLSYTNSHPEIDAIFTIRKNNNELVSVMSVGFKKHLLK